MGEHHRIGSLSRTLRPCTPQLISQILHPIVAQRNKLGVEGVRLRDIGTRFKVTPMNFLNDLRLSEVEKFVVPLEVFSRPILEPLTSKLLFG